MVDIETGLLTKNTGTSQVIHSLHNTIDTLTDELVESKQQALDFKKKYDMLLKKHDHIMEQLANSKHESDMINALLKRKERRIQDMETLYGDSVSLAENLEFKNKNLEIRCKKLEESEQNSVTEYERLKIAYDTIVRSQNEYRSHFTNEIQLLKTTLANFIQDRAASLATTTERFDASSVGAERLLDNLVGKSRDLEGIYSKKNTVIIDSLKQLALAARDHGEGVSSVLSHGEVVLNEVYKHFPELKEMRDSTLTAPKPEPESIASVSEQAVAAAESVVSPLVMQKSRLPSSSRRRVTSTSNAHKRRSSRFENISIMAPEEERDAGVASLPKRPVRTPSVRIPSRTELEAVMPDAGAGGLSSRADDRGSVPSTNHSPVEGLHPVDTAPPARVVSNGDLTSKLADTPEPRNLEALVPRNLGVLASKTPATPEPFSSPETVYGATDADVSVNTDDTLVSIHQVPNTPLQDGEATEKKRKNKKKKNKKKAATPDHEVLESIHNLVAQIETS